MAKLFALVLFGLSFFPASVAAQQSADLVIEKLSVASTLPPDSTGTHRVTVSFRVHNLGPGAAVSCRTRVTIGSVADYVTPALKKDEVAFISRTVSTNQGILAVAVYADFYHNVSDVNEQNNFAQATARVRDPGRWISIGPIRIYDVPDSMGRGAVGRVTTIAVDPNSPLTVYAGARGSGLWRATGQYVDWQPISDSLPSLQIDAVAVDPRNGEHILVATPAGVFESRNSGAVWIQLTNANLMAFGNDGGAFLIANTPNPPMYLTTLTGLVISTDGGKNWLPVLGSPQAQVTSLQFSTTDPTHLYAAQGGANPAIFEGINRGLTSASWRQLSGCPGAELPLMLPGKDTKVWISESQGKKYLSFRDSNGVAEIWRAKSSCNTEFVTENSWEYVPQSGDCKQVENHWSYLFAHPVYPEIVFKGGVKLCRSKQNAANMGTLSNIHDDHHAIVVAPSAPNVMYFGSDGGISRSVDNGVSIQFISGGLSNTEFLDVDVDGAESNFAVGGTHDNGYITWNGLVSVWKYIDGGDSAIVEFDRDDPKRFYAVGPGTRQITRRGGSGDPSEQGKDPLPDFCVYSEKPNLFGSMAAIGGNKPLAITANGLWVGPPWTEIKAAPNPPNPGDCYPPAGAFSRLKFYPGGVLVAATNRGTVFLWPPVTQVFQPPTPADATTAIAFVGPTTFYVSFRNGTNASIYRLECLLGCQSKKVCDDAATNGLKKCAGRGAEITAMVVDPNAPNELLVAVRAKGMFRGTQGAAGWEWTTYNNGLPDGVTITDLEASRDGSIIAATWGRGAYQLFSPTADQRVARGQIVQFALGQMNGKGASVTTITVSTKPGWSFTTSDPVLVNKLKIARARKKAIRITYQTMTPNSGKLLSVSIVP